MCAAGLLSCAPIALRGKAGLWVLSATDQPAQRADHRGAVARRPR
jgi:hypothetical protein